MQKITIIGVGLLGGSVGLAVKGGPGGGRVVGCGHREASLIDAQRLGAVDGWTLDAADAVRDADLVVVCVPVGQLPAWLARIAPHLKPGAVVTDVGSTKAAIVAAGEAAVKGPAYFVGSHPMAGGSQSGVAAARADLFAGATCVVTPTEQTDANALAKIEAFWRQLGMRIVRQNPSEHDRLVALVSHLPHAAAAALVAVQSPASVDLRGRGYTDTTRVAAGDAGLWRDIFLDNKTNVVEAIDRFGAELKRLRDLIAASDAESLTAWLAAQAKAREAITPPGPNSDA
ncbi:MAG: prephenate dehydrogenase [Tepidisphaeraceae bacterium]